MKNKYKKWKFGFDENSFWYLRLFQRPIKERYNNNILIYNDGQKSREVVPSYIYGQKNLIVKNLRFGVETVSKVGCGAIAIQNVMCKLSKPQNFLNVLTELELNGALRLFGKWGVRYKSIKRYFDAHGINYIEYKDATKYKREMKMYEIALIYTKNPDGISEHYFCVEQRRGDNNISSFFTYNRYDKDEKAKKLIDIDSIFKNQIKYVLAFKKAPDM